jgi:hypothetical protein
MVRLTRVASCGMQEISENVNITRTAQSRIVTYSYYIALFKSQTRVLQKLLSSRNLKISLTILWNPEFYRCIYRSMPLVSILSQTNPVHIHGAKPFLRSHQMCSYSKFSNILWNLKVHYCVHKSPPLVPTLSQINQYIPPHSISLRFISILSTHLRLRLPSVIITIILSASLFRCHKLLCFVFYTRLFLAFTRAHFVIGS